MSDLPEDRLKQFAAEYQRPVPLDTHAKERLLAAVRASRPPRRAWTRRWVAPALAAAALAVIAFGVTLSLGRGLRLGGGADAPARTAGSVPDSQRLVQFVLVAPEASHVSVVGDFNGWDPQATPMSRTASDDPWSARVPVAPGLHVYAFVVDGRHWVADPQAPLAPEDGLGIRNSVIVVDG